METIQNAKKIKKKTRKSLVRSFTSIYFSLRKVTLETIKKGKSALIGLFTIVLVVFFVVKKKLNFKLECSVTQPRKKKCFLLNTVTKTPIIFMKQAKDSIGHQDIV